VSAYHPAVPAHAGRRDIAIAVASLVGLSRLVEPPVAALVAGLVMAAVALGVLQLLGEGSPFGGGPGVPVESLITPAVAAGAAVGVVRLVPADLWLVPAVALAGWLAALAFSVEARVVRSAVGPSAADRTAMLVASLVTAFAAFTGAAALVPGGLPEPGPVDVVADGTGFVALAAADALVAALVGYRIAAIRSPNARDAAWFALTCLIVVVTAAAAVRVLELPRLLGPALLTLVVFLWDAIHGTPGARRRDARWIWETSLLIVLAIVVVAWALGSRA
jgi:hypothetical protein